MGFHVAIGGQLTLEKPSQEWLETGMDEQPLAHQGAANGDFARRAPCQSKTFRFIR
ncbi:hypothetical protein [Chania multitudinisentens]|uniref:hypothetical protein n=1 Tax=Chania multitudinisentens TaxID=1639108 RepID=UPI0004B5247B|nr:hypothetical protein [Chania multitudinisentens]